MGKYAEKALELHAKGYNCAQAVACAFSDQVDMDEDQLFKVMEGFGAGMGGMPRLKQIHQIRLLARHAGI